MFKLYCTNCPYERVYKWIFDPKRPTAYCHSCKSRKVMVEIGDTLTYYDNKTPILTISRSAVQWFRAYQEVQKSGELNMITEALKASKRAGLSIEQYQYVIDHFEQLAEVSGLLIFHKI